MFRIRRVHDHLLPINKQAVEDVQKILRDQFPAVQATEIEQIPEKIHNPFKQRFCTMLHVAENSKGSVQGFALVMHDPELGFCYLDYLAADKMRPGRGIGAALYGRVREEALALKARGLFFECLPDNPEGCRDPQILAQNVARLRFYEQYGARPIIDTKYETPVTPGDDDNLPHLVFDGLDTHPRLPAQYARKVVRAILERKYGDLCSAQYIDAVVRSFRDDPIKLREPRYEQASAPAAHIRGPHVELAGMFVTDKHDIHHIRERGYVEAPARIRVIRAELMRSGLVENLPVKTYPEKHISAVHAPELIDYLRRASANVPEGKSVYPYVFPIRNATRPPKELSVRAGYYCIDTFTPINSYVIPAAKRAVDCALSAADETLRGRRFTYALVRPPGHHAEHRSFGGFCYFNNAAIAANYLSRFGKVAILDVDYHHGNGQQDIFYRRSDVLTVSIHGDPDFAYPYFTGFADERGEEAGEGFNVNLPLPEVQDGAQYRKTLEKALGVIANYQPVFLIISLGLDPAKGDPTGTWMLKSTDFEQNGIMIARMGLPTLVVQEGGYRTKTLGVNARSFFKGLVTGTQKR